MVVEVSCRRCAKVGVLCEPRTLHPIVRAVVLTSRCTGPWPEPCREAWPATRQAWCRQCQRSSSPQAGGQ